MNTEDQVGQMFSYGTGPRRVCLRRPLFLAPLAGATEICFREICHELGAGQVCTELVSARGIRYSGLEACRRYLEIDPKREGPVAIQLFGFDPEDFRYAAAALLDDPRYRHMAALDINMGCPVKKVVKTGAGAALMLDVKRAVAIVKAVKSIIDPVGIPVSCKFRKGYAADESTALDFGLEMAEAGVDLLAIHARTQAQGYSGTADHQVTAALCSALRARGYKQPLIANGDIDGVESAGRILAETGADGLMIGRAAMQDPFVFERIAAALYPETFSETERREAEACEAGEDYCRRLGLARRYYEALADRLGELRASREIRAVLMKLFAHFPGASHLRAQISELADRASYRDFFDALEANLKRRYSNPCD
ncbi:MAG: tRNA-dihydrouridine synthase family protein [Eubacteriales bacterium]|nr:tRNA-dihydrouridine synthase family protein [Eubacteriales bacterium]